MAKKTIVLVDNDVVRAGLRSAIFRQFTILAEGETGPDAVRLAKEHEPDVLLLEVRLPKLDGLDALERIRKDVPSTSVVFLSTFDNPTYIARAAAGGATEYFLKSLPLAAIASDLAATCKGDYFSSSSSMRRVKAVMTKKKEVGNEDIPLTPRETQVLRHIALGLSNKEIGKALNISVETVKEHVQNLLPKIGCRDRTQAAVWAVRNNLA